MGRGLAGVLMLACALSCLAQGSDSVLTCYWLAPQQAEQFSDSDGVVSPFWYDWTGRDSITMTPDSNARGGAGGCDGKADPRVTVKTAGCVEGLLALYVVDDDVWVDSLAGGFRSERLSFYHDRVSADSIRRCGDCLLGVYAATLTYNYRQVTLQLGGTDTLPQRFTLLGNDPEWFCVVCDVELTFAQARAFGVRMETVQVSAGTKAVEVLLPWWEFSTPEVFREPVDGSLGVVPAQGSRYAYSVDHIDVDATADSCWLSWREDTPWFGYYWGDLEFGPNFPVVPTPVESLLVGAVLGARAVARQWPESRRVAAYDLRGRRMGAPQLGPSHGVMLQRSPTGSTTMQLHLMKR